MPSTGKSVATTAQIDTGSTITGADQTLLQSLGAPAVGSLPVGTPGGSYQADLYQAQVIYRGINLTAGLPGGVLGEDLPAPLQALIGRDVLQQYDFIYDGTEGAWSLSSTGIAPALGSSTALWIGAGLVVAGAGIVLLAEAARGEHRQALARRHYGGYSGRRAA